MDRPASIGKGGAVFLSAMNSELIEWLRGRANSSLFLKLRWCPDTSLRAQFLCALSFASRLCVKPLFGEDVVHAKAQNMT
jgi:hypothetical protein